MKKKIKDLDKIKKICYKHMKSILTPENYEHLKSNLTIKIDKFKKKNVFGVCDVKKDKFSIIISEDTLKKDDNFIEYVVLHELFHVLTTNYVFKEITDINEFATEYLCLIHFNEKKMKYPKLFLNKLTLVKIHRFYIILFKKLEEQIKIQEGIGKKEEK